MVGSRAGRAVKPIPTGKTFRPLGQTIMKTTRLASSMFMNCNLSAWNWVSADTWPIPVNGSRIHPLFVTHILEAEALGEAQREAIALAKERVQQVVSDLKAIS